MRFLTLTILLLGSSALTTGAALAQDTQTQTPAPAAVQPQESTLTLQQALRSAYQNNPTIQAARAQVKATQEFLPQANANWQPFVSAGANVTRTDYSGDTTDISGDGSTAKGADVSFEQPVYRGGRTMAEIAAAKYTIEAQKAALMIQEQQTLLDAVTAYMNVLRDQAVLDLRENNHDVIARQKQVTTERFQVGELTKTDVSQSQARLARAEADVITAQGNLRSTVAVFQQIIGLPPGTLSQPQIPISMPATLDETTGVAESSNPSVLAATYIHQASEKDIDNAFGELLPDVSVFGSVGKTYDPDPGLSDDIRASAIGIEASIPLYEGGAVRSRVRQAKHISNRRYLEILEARRQAHQLAVTNWEALQTARAEIRSRQAQVEAATVAQEGIRAEAAYGTRTVIDALDADQEALDAQVSLVTAQRNEIVAEFALAATLGYLTPQTLGFPDAAINPAATRPQGIAGTLNMDVDRVGKPQ